MKENNTPLVPLRGEITLTRCVPEGSEITHQTAYRAVSTETFRQIRYFARGSTCFAYEATDETGNRRVLTEFCPGQNSLRSAICRAGNQELVLQTQSSLVRYDYFRQRLHFIKKWHIQKTRQARDTALGNNGPELYFLGDCPFLVMYYDGQPTRDFSRIHPRDLLHVLGQVCASIHQEHCAGLLLNDIKPDNLLFTTLGDTLFFRRLLDYGSAVELQALRRMDPRTDVVFSTSQFCSRELKSRAYGTITYASDVYSFGKTVLWMLCGFDPQLYLDSPQRFRSVINAMAPHDAPIRRLDAKDPDLFYASLYSFALHTISDDVMPGDRVYDWETDPFHMGPEGPARLRSMADVKRLLAMVERAAASPDAIDLGLALRIAGKKAEQFEGQGYANSQETELEQKLFSTDLLISYRDQDGALVLPEDLTRMSGCVFLEGISGAGKSVGLRYLYKRLADGAKASAGELLRLPVYIPLARVAAGGGDLDRHIARELFGEQTESRKARETVRSWLRGGKGVHLVLLCDGINEVPAESSRVELVDELDHLAEAAEAGHLTMLYSGQNHLAELKNFRGQILTAQPLSWAAVKAYFYDRFPHAAADPAIEQKLENLRNVLTTAQRVHDLCVPHINKTRIHPRALPQSETALLHDYVHAWSAKEKIHKAICGSTAYSSGQEAGEAYGELLIGELAQLCWTMARKGDHYVNKRALLAQLERTLHPDGDPAATLGSSYLTETEERQVLSLIWTGVLFDLDGSEMHIRHESYRDYLAAEYLAGLCNRYTETGFPPDLMLPIPDKVLRRMLPMLTGDALQRICSRLKTAQWELVKDAVKAQIAGMFDRTYEKSHMSDLHDDDLNQALKTMVRLVWASGLTRRAKWRILKSTGIHPLFLLPWRKPL